MLPRDLLSTLKFVVVGAGALGNEAVKSLGLLGAGSVVIIDPDKVEPSNLSRSIFFQNADCGQPKASTLANALARTLPNTRWEHRNCEIADVGFQDLAASDLILSCVDTDLARVEISWVGLRLNLPVADAGLGGPDYWRGRVSFFAGRRSACFCCKLSPRRRRELLLTAQTAGQACWSETKTTSLPSTPTMAAIVGSLQVDFGLRSFLELRDSRDQEFTSSTIEISLGSAPELSQFSTHRCRQCPLHVIPGREPVPLPHAYATPRELLDSVEMQAVDLD
jgi:hypothetical protein